MITIPHQPDVNPVIINNKKYFGRNEINHYGKGEEMAKDKPVEKKEQKLTDKQIRANIITLGGHIKNFDYLLMHFIQFLGKEAEFKKYMIDVQEEAKKNAKQESEAKKNGQKEKAPSN